MFVYDSGDSCLEKQFPHFLYLHVTLLVLEWVVPLPGRHVGEILSVT